MRAVAEAMKGLLEGAEGKKQSQELEAMKMSIDTLIRTTKKAMVEKEKEAVAQIPTRTEEPAREEALEKAVEIRF
jgi:hypothetical protein